MSNEIHTLIIGGGIIGMMTAMELKKRFPLDEIVVLEQSPFLADHSTGRNSGVLHSGIYYETHSQKHLLCMAGLEDWVELIKKYTLPHRWCGKYIFAHSHSEVEALARLEVKAAQNGVPAQLCTQRELAALSEHVNAYQALKITTTGIVDVSEAMAALRRDFESRGGIIQLSTQVTSIERQPIGFLINTPEYVVECSQLINAAGLWAPEIRAMIGLSGMKSRWVKWHYLKTSQSLKYDTLYYPVPPTDLKGLGVHSTIDCQGDVKFGPDTLDVNEIDYKLETQNLELMRASVKERFIGVDTERLMPDYAGIRSKIEVEGVLHKDFWIKSPCTGYAEACGIESPGMTSAPAIAKMLCDLLS